MFVAPKIVVRLSTELDNMSIGINYCPDKRGQVFIFHIATFLLVLYVCNVEYEDLTPIYLNQLSFAGDSDRSDWQVTHFVAGGR